jgi:hypothetical protein
MHHINRRKCTRREFKMIVVLGIYEMNNVMLNLGFDVNILPKTYWELMGKPNLVWSPIQLRISNQYRIYLIARLQQVEVNIDGVKTKADFEVIEIMDDSDRYIDLLGIDRAFDYNVVLNLKQQNMSFETNTLRLIVPLDPNEGNRYNDLVNEDAESSIIKKIYNITRCKQDYVSPIVDNEPSWRCVHSYDTDLEDATKIW